ncbi:MAG: hypothetical protein AAFP04_08110 [Myxococcota bacterium]
MSNWEIWRGPIGVAAASALGMGVALGANGGGDVFSWFALSVPVVVSFTFIIRAYMKERRSL